MVQEWRYNKYFKTFAIIGLIAIVLLEIINFQRNSPSLLVYNYLVRQFRPNSVFLEESPIEKIHQARHQVTTVILSKQFSITGGNERQVAFMVAFDCNEATKNDITPAQLISQGQQSVEQLSSSASISVTFFFFLYNCSSNLGLTGDTSVSFLISRNEISPDFRNTAYCLDGKSLRKLLNDAANQEDDDSSQFSCIFSLRHLDSRITLPLMSPLMIKQFVDDVGNLLGFVDVHAEPQSLYNSEHNDTILTYKKRFGMSDQKTNNLPFSADFFGGRLWSVNKLCHQASECSAARNHSNELERRSCLENALRSTEEPPTHFVSSSYFLPERVPRFYANQSVVRYLVSSVKRHYGFYVNVSRSIVESQRRRNITSEVVQKIVNRYFRNASKVIMHSSRYNADHPTNKTLGRKFLAYCCENWMLCGGLGDRLKGTASLFYTAIASERVFHMDWEKPVDFFEYFKINSNWYNVSPSVYNEQRRISRIRRHWWWPMDGLAKDLIEQLANTSFVEMYDHVDAFDITANRLKMLESIFHNPAFLPALSDIFPELLDADFNHTHDVDYGLVISAAYRALFSVPQSNLTNMINAVVNNSFNHEAWQGALKIGVQIRTCQLQWGEGGSRVEHKQIACFAEKVKELAGMMRSGPDQKVAVFVTSDYENASNVMRDLLTNESYMVVLNTESAISDEYNITLKHLDRSDVSKNRTVAWFEMSKVYIDWLFLVQMDFLLISRSGYGETASMYSLKPTWQFIHWPPQENNPCPFIEYSDRKTGFEFR